MRSVAVSFAASSRQELTVPAYVNRYQPPHWENEASSPRCLAGPLARVTPTRWSGVIRDAILDGQWNVAIIIRGTQALACPVEQVNG